MRKFYFKPKISLILLASTTITLWLYDYFTKNIQNTELDIVILLALLLGSYTYLRVIKKFRIPHFIVALALLILSVSNFCWSLFSFAFYGFNGAKLPVYAYALLATNLAYIILSYYDAVIAGK